VRCSVFSYIGHGLVLRLEKKRSIGRKSDPDAATNLLRKGPIRASMPASAAELSYLEKKVLLALQKRKKASPEELKAAGKFRELVEVMNAASWLQAKGLVTMKERVVRTYRLARPEVARRALPERKALAALLRASGRLPVPKLQAACKFDDGQLAVALGWLRRKGWAEVSKGSTGSVVSVTPAGRAAAKAKGPDEILLARLAKGELPEDAIDPGLIRNLKSRRDLVKERESVRREIALTPAGEKIVAAGLDLKEEVAQPTTDLLRSGKWREVEFRRYDAKSFAPLIRPGKRHVLGAYIEKIRRIFLSMGFTEIQGDFVLPAFWNFDALFQPQDHPARDQLDTFYLSKPSRMPLPDERVVRRVAEVHETGGSTGSTGWRYPWDRAEAERAVLRSHTTPITLRWLGEHPEPPQKAFIIGRVFRPDAIDVTHLPEFHQIEGVVMEDGANLAQLIGIIEEFYRRLGFARAKFRPGYFPYTEPSMEPEVQRSDGRWMELGGSGIFRPEVTAPFGLKAPVLAWGLGLERVIMAIEGISDIRQLYLSDLDWLRDHRAIV
jgi:phenylalanyl-tRNA synthetase alpha chain